MDVNSKGEMVVGTKGGEIVEISLIDLFGLFAIILTALEN